MAASSSTMQTRTLAFMRCIVHAFSERAYSLMAEVHPVLLDRSGNRLGPPLEKRRHPCQIRETVGLHLGHYRAAMELHGGLLDVERVSYLLVHSPLANERHDFALTTRQALVAPAQFVQI